LFAAARTVLLYLLTVSRIHEGVEAIFGYRWRSAHTTATLRCAVRIDSRSTTRMTQKSWAWKRCAVQTTRWLAKYRGARCMRVIAGIAATPN